MLPVSLALCTMQLQIDIKDRHGTNTEAWWHIGMSSASHREDPGSNPGKGRFFRIKMKKVTFELLRCIYSHIWWIYNLSVVSIQT